jgi:hypothetical protein
MDRQWFANGKTRKNDWYETVKVNYGIRPDGSKDFENPIMILSGKKCRTLGINLGYRIILTEGRWRIWMAL